MHNYKPSGFWVSVEGNGDGWSDFAAENEHLYKRMQYAHKITLHQDANILYISSVEEMQRFNEAYKDSP